jgi:hypothetical protein
MSSPDNREKHELFLTNAAFRFEISSAESASAAGDGVAGRMATPPHVNPS